MHIVTDKICNKHKENKINRSGEIICMKCANEKAKNWYRNNKEKCKKAAKIYRLANSEKEKNRINKWRAENKAKEKEYRLEKKDTYSMYAENRRARVKGNGGTYTALEWKSLCDKYNNKCLACGAIGNLTVDHVIPVSKGGGSAINNLQPLCKRCNSSKRNKIIDYRK